MVKRQYDFIFNLLACEIETVERRFHIVCQIANASFKK